MKKINASALLLFALVCSFTAFGQTPKPLPRLRVSENGRFFVTESGQPFFWLGDTAWLLFEKLDRAEADQYLADRARKEFNITLAQILPWEHGGTNVYGETAFVNKDFTQPNEKYWQHADYVIDRAAARGLYVGMLPMWCRNYIERRKEQPLIDAAAAYSYGKFLGARYRQRSHLVWLLGGDDPPTKHEVYDAMAKGITDGAGRDVLMSYHPPSTVISTAAFYADKPWMDFNLFQSGHREVWFSYQNAAADYARTPVKPTLESEPNYENHPIKHKMENGVFNAWHVRSRVYWSVFAGGAGVTYGGNGVWQMDKAGQPPFLATHANLSWDKALDLPGATQMKYLRRLIESRPFLSRVPDDGAALASPAGENRTRVQVTRDANRSWALYYISDGHAITPALPHLKGPQLKAWWFNPRDGRLYDNAGKATGKPFGTFANSGKGVVFKPPVTVSAALEESDWVLVLDNAASNFPPPGQRKP